MPRPIKNYCEYFPHDRDMRNHKKVKAIRTKFGIQGYAIWSMILETLTGSDGNVLEYSDLEFELLSGDYGVSGAEIRSVVDYCVSLDMIFIKDGFFHSESLDERLLPVYEKRKVQKSKSSKQRRVHGKFVSDNSVDNGVSATEIPQSKVKYSKVDNSKEKRESTELTPDLKNSNLFKKPVIPTKQQVWEAISHAGGTKEMAKSFYEKHESTGWFINGSPIVNYVTLAQRFVTNWKSMDDKNKKTEKVQPTAAPLTKIKPS